ncbi:MAG: hypothetical protein HY900_03980 [Deltaproteobacteria bacterium]|nr:hypothetical protein [Deltaproteobacteria bacterium]
MKTIRTALTTLALALTAAPALAVDGARADHSGVLVWAFLGLCAMIVAAQVVPAALMLVGMVRGVFAKPVEAE